MNLPRQRVSLPNRMRSIGELSSLSFCGEVSWSTEQYIEAHLAVVSSGRHNFQGCRIPIPTTIRYDRLRLALGEEVSAKQARVLDLLKYGMPIDCQSKFGVRRKQKNHHSAVSFKAEIEEYLRKNLHCKAILGPLNTLLSPIYALAL